MVYCKKHIRAKTTKKSISSQGHSAFMGFFSLYVILWYAQYKPKNHIRHIMFVSEKETYHSLFTLIENNFRIFKIAKFEFKVTLHYGLSEKCTQLWRLKLVGLHHTVISITVVSDLLHRRSYAICRHQLLEMWYFLETKSVNDDVTSKLQLKVGINLSVMLWFNPFLIYRQEVLHFLMGRE